MSDQQKIAPSREDLLDARSLPQCPCQSFALASYTFEGSFQGVSMLEDQLQEVLGQTV